MADFAASSDCQLRFQPRVSQQRQ